MVHIVVLAVAAATAVSASPIFQDLLVHQRINAPPSSFVSYGAAESKATLNLRIGLRQTDMPGLEKTLYAISTPGSDQYGKFLSRNELAEYVRPSAQSISMVNEWLLSNGLLGKSISFAGDWLAVSVPVGKGNEMLDANFTVFMDKTGRRMIRTLSYSIPSFLKDHVDLLHPTIDFAHVESFRPKSHFQKLARVNGEGYDLPESCQYEITPQCLQVLYGIPTTPATQMNNGLFVSEFEGVWAAPSDLLTFLQTFRPDMNPNTTFALLSINGGINNNDPGEAGVESDIDIQYTVGVAQGVPITLVTVSPPDFDLFQSILDEANYLVTMDNPPTVLTTSYGTDETDVSLAMAIAICNTYMQLGAVGISVLYASGDGGVAGAQSSQSECADEQFIPVFPATCPYVTSVGATQLGLGNTTEGAAEFASGGFSNYFTQAPYQTSAVEGFIQSLGPTYSGLYNVSGRGFPDVSANGVGISIVWDGISPILAEGTSCSSPIFASIVSLLNDQLLSAGKPPMGFLNPFLYSTGVSGLTDITLGNNPGCNTNGFNAIIGWDPISGLGTPNYPALLSALGL